MTRLIGTALALVVGANLVGQVPYWDLFKAVAGSKAAWRAAQIRAESGFNPSAQSFIMNKQGQVVPCAQGLGQFTPATWATWGDGGSPWIPEHQIKANHRFMSYLEGQFLGDSIKALGAYNCGPGNVKKADRLAQSIGIEGSRAWLQVLHRVTGFNKLTGKPHADETRTYIQRIETVHYPWVLARTRSNP